jgi:hypothetical protein
VGVAFYGTPQDWLWGRFLFGFALYFFVYFGVASTIIAIHPTWLYVESIAVWMWKHVEFSLADELSQIV